MTNMARPTGPGVSGYKDIDFKYLEKLCNIQCTKREVCAVFKCCSATIDRRIQEEYGQSWTEFYEQHRGDGLVSLRRKQLEVALTGNPTLLIWLGKQFLIRVIKKNWQYQRKQSKRKYQIGRRKMSNINQTLDGLKSLLKASVVVTIDPKTRKHSKAVDESKMKRAKAAMKAALVEVKKKKNNKEELLKFLSWQRSVKKIEIADEYKLNELEEAKCKRVAECHSKISSAYNVHINDEVRFDTYFDEDRQTDMYRFYVRHVIKPEEQIGRDLGWKIDQGFRPEEKDYPEPKTLITRRVLRESEFLKYFRITDNGLEELDGGQILADQIAAEEAGE